MNDIARTSELAERLAAVRERIAAAASDAGRSAAELTTIVVTKFHSAQMIRDLAALGVQNVGENRHQEAQAKAAELADLDLTWHFVGQLQSKKARQVRRYASVVHSVDRPALVHALSGDTGMLDCFVQINLTDDPYRGGVAEGELEPLIESVLAAEGLRLLGVMAVAPLGEDARTAFARLRSLSERVQLLAPGASAISAGMSEDFAEAIAEGATHLRIGTAITGKRRGGR